jgi:hypothetical protein
MRLEARLFELLLPLVACGCVFASIPKQMKNFLSTGLVLMLTAARYAPLKLALTRWWRRGA